MDDVAGLVAVFTVVCGAALIAWGIYGRQRLHELAMRERLALIERGLVPSPEADPEGFERVLGPRRRLSAKALRYRSAGVILMGLGGGLFVLLAFAAGVPEVAIGTGGALAVLGLAVFLNGTLLPHEDTPAASPVATPPRPAVAHEPPTNIAP